jgi:hypothetical protein
VGINEGILVGVDVGNMVGDGVRLGILVGVDVIKLGAQEIIFGVLFHNTGL